MNKGIIIGDNVIVPAGDYSITSINKNDVEFTSADDGKTFLGESCEIDADGRITAVVHNPYALKTISFSTETNLKIHVIDATAGNITVTIEQFTDFIFQRRDGSANTVTITPGSGTINGAASMTLTQYQKIHVITDGTNYYY